MSLDNKERRDPRDRRFVQQIQHRTLLTVKAVSLICFFFCDLRTFQLVHKLPSLEKNRSPKVLFKD